MPRLLKHIGVALLIALFRAAMAVKRVIAFTLRLVVIPLAWVYRRILLPILGTAYSVFRSVRRQVMGVVEHVRDGVLRLLANRFAMHAAVIVLSCSVAVANVSARDTSSDAVGISKQSIVDTLQGDIAFDERYEVEEAQLEPANDAAVSYLGGTALSAHDVLDSGITYDGSDSGQELTDEEDVNLDSPLANAVRVTPVFEEGQVPTRTKVEQHIVQPGETLGSIAQLYGIRVSTITAANQIKNGYIHPGDTIRILPVDGVIITVKKGDTVAKLADKYGSAAESILDANGITDGTVTIGMELVLPGGKIPEVIKPAPKPAPKPPSRIGSGIADNIKNVVIPPASSNKNNGARMVWPTAARRITQYWKGRAHTGVDIAGPIGTAIYAADDGVVLKAEWNSGGYGYMTVIDHGGGVYTRYGHASKMLTKPGQTVKRGEVIALMGSTGRSTGPHLHFEVMTGTVSHRVNPLEWTKL